MRVTSNANQAPRGSHTHGRLTVLALALATLVAAPATRAQSGRERVDGVRNFGKVTERIFRGGEVTPEGVENLAQMGVRTFIDLLDKPKPEEPAWCESHGIKYLNYSLTGHDPLDDKMVDEILAIMKNAAAPVFVHCDAGRHRAGTIVALYRIRVQGWAKERAWAEQESYGFGMPEEHPELYAYVYGGGKADAGKPAAGPGLSAEAKYVPLAKAVAGARAQGGTGELLKVDLEWDKVRLIPTWDVTFSSGLEYELDAMSGKFLDSKPKEPAKLAVYTPLQLSGTATTVAVTFQDILRSVLSNGSQAVMGMELKQVKGHAMVVYEVSLADGSIFYYDAATGRAVDSL